MLVCNHLRFDCLWHWESNIKSQFVCRLRNETSMPYTWQFKLLTTPVFFHAYIIVIMIRQFEIALFSGFISSSEFYGAVNSKLIPILWNVIRLLMSFTLGNLYIVKYSSQWIYKHVPSPLDSIIHCTCDSSPLVKKGR